MFFTKLNGTDWKRANTTISLTLKILSVAYKRLLGIRKLSAH